MADNKGEQLKKNVQGQLGEDPVTPGNPQNQGDPLEPQVPVIEDPQYYMDTVRKLKDAQEDLKAIQEQMNQKNEEMSKLHEEFMKLQTENQKLAKEMLDALP